MSGKLLLPLVEDFVRNVWKIVDSYRNGQVVTRVLDKNSFNSLMTYEVFNYPEIQRTLKRRNITIVWDVVEKDNLNT